MSSDRSREFLEAQGFVGLSDCDIPEFSGWLRFAPAVCLTWTGVGLVFGSPALIAMLVPFALVGGLWDRHPFELVHEYGIRQITGTSRLPRYGRQRRFACLMASVVLSLTALALYLGYSVLGYSLGASMVILASINVSTGFCVPSFIYNRLFGGKTSPVPHVESVSI